MAKKDTTPQSAGGNARAKKLTSEERRQIALAAAKAGGLRLKTPTEYRKLRVTGYFKSVRYPSMYIG